MKIKNLKVNKENFSEEVTLEREASTFKKNAIIHGTLTAGFAGMGIYSVVNLTPVTPFMIVLTLLAIKNNVSSYFDNIYGYRSTKEKMKTLTKNEEN